MNIPVAQLLNKMNEHIQTAANQNEDTLREHIVAIRTLCELILENDQLQSNTKTIPSIATNIQVLQPAAKNVQILDNDKDGGSIFDF